MSVWPQVPPSTALRSRGWGGGFPPKRSWGQTHIWGLSTSDVQVTARMSFAHLFSRANKEGFSFFFPVGRPRPEPSSKPSPCRLPFSTRKSRFEVPERGKFWGRILPGEGCGGQGKKRKKGCTRKGGFVLTLQPIRGKFLENARGGCKSPCPCGGCKTSFRWPPSTDYFFRFWAF